MKVGPTDEGNQEHLTCGYSSGDTPIEVYWMRQGKRLGTSSRIDVLSLSSLSVLTIKSAIAEDAGMYTCVANNSAGTVRETAEIIVYGKMLNVVRRGNNAENCSVICLWCDIHGLSCLLQEQ